MMKITVRKGRMIIRVQPTPAWKLEDERLHLEKLNELAREMEQIIMEVTD